MPDYEVRENLDNTFTIREAPSPEEKVTGCIGFFIWIMVGAPLYLLGQSGSIGLHLPLPRWEFAGAIAIFVLICLSFILLVAFEANFRRFPKTTLCLFVAYQILTFNMYTGGAISRRYQEFREAINVSGISESRNISQASSTGTPISSPSLPNASIVTKTTISNLNLRLGPGTEYSIVTVIQKGAEVRLLNETREIDGQEWVKVRVVESEGWVNQKFLK